MEWRKKNICCRQTVYLLYHAPVLVFISNHIYDSVVMSIYTCLCMPTHTCIQTTGLQKSWWPDLQEIINCFAVMRRNIWCLFQTLTSLICKTCFFPLGLSLREHWTAFSVLLLGKQSQLRSVLFLNSSNSEEYQTCIFSLSDGYLVQCKN